MPATPEFRSPTKEIDMLSGPASWIAFILIIAVVVLGGGVVGALGRARDNRNLRSGRNS